MSPLPTETRLSSVFIAIRQVQGSIFFIGVSSSRALELMQSASRDIYEFIEGRNVDLLVGEVGDYSESCNWMVKYRAVEFRDDVSTALVL